MFYLNYKLNGIISSPYVGHYSAWVINLKNDIRLLEKNCDYY